MPEGQHGQTDPKKQSKREKTEAKAKAKAKAKGGREKSPAPSEGDGACWQCGKPRTEHSNKRLCPAPSGKGQKGSGGKGDKTQTGGAKKGLAAGRRGYLTLSSGS